MEPTTQINERNPFGQAQDDGSDEIDLLKLWNTVWQRKWSIITLVLVVSMIAALWANSLTPIYQAETTLLIQRDTPKAVSFDQGYGYGGYDYEFLDTQFELLKSRSLAERVVRMLNLTTDPKFDPRQQPPAEPPLIDIRGFLANFDFNKVVPATLPEDLEVEQAAAEADILEEITSQVMGITSVSPVQNTQLVAIQVEMEDPRMAAVIANALATGFIEGQMEASMDMSATATTWMNSRLRGFPLKLNEPH